MLRCEAGASGAVWGEEWAGPGRAFNLLAPCHSAILPFCTWEAFANKRCPANSHACAKLNSAHIDANHRSGTHAVLVKLGMD